MDVGFGNAALLFTAAEFGFTPVGLDLRQKSVVSLASVGCEAHCADILEWEPAEPLQVISMADVLEHMPYPGRALSRAREIMRPDGTLFVSMPNMGSPLWDLMTSLNNNPYWGEQEHYHNFTHSRLFALLKETGFEPVHYGVSERYRCCMEIVARPI